MSGISASLALLALVKHLVARLHFRLLALPVLLAAAPVMLPNLMLECIVEDQRAPFLVALAAIAHPDPEALVCPRLHNQGQVQPQAHVRHPNMRLDVTWGRPTCGWMCPGVAIDAAWHCLGSATMAYGCGSVPLGLASVPYKFGF